MVNSDFDQPTAVPQEDYYHIHFCILTVCTLVGHIACLEDGIMSERHFNGVLTRKCGITRLICLFLMYELTNINVFWVQWSPNGVAQNQDILKNTQQCKLILQVNVWFFIKTNSSHFECVVLICTLPLNDSQTLTQHPPVCQWIRKTGGKTAEKHLWSLLLYLTVHLLLYQPKYVKVHTQQSISLSESYSM